MHYQLPSLETSYRVMHAMVNSQAHPLSFYLYIHSIHCELYKCKSYVLHNVTISVAAAFGWTGRFHSSIHQHTCRLFRSKSLLSNGHNQQPRGTPYMGMRPLKTVAATNVPEFEAARSYYYLPAFIIYVPQGCRNHTLYSQYMHIAMVKAVQCV